MSSRVALSSEITYLANRAFLRGRAVNSADRVCVVQANSAKPVIGRVLAGAQRGRGFNWHIRRIFRRRVFDDGGTGRGQRSRCRCRRGKIPRVTVVHVMVACIPLRALARHPSGTGHSAFAVCILQTYPTPVMVDWVVTLPRVSRPRRSSTTSSRGLIGRFPGHEPIAMSESCVALSICKAFHSEVLELALAAHSRWAVLPGPAVFVVPFVATEEPIFRPIRPYCRFDCNLECFDNQKAQKDLPYKKVTASILLVLPPCLDSRGRCCENNWPPTTCSRCDHVRVVSKRFADRIPSFGSFEAQKFALIFASYFSPCSGLGMGGSTTPFLSKLNKASSSCPESRRPKSADRPGIEFTR